MNMKAWPGLSTGQAFLKLQLRREFLLAIPRLRGAMLLAIAK